MIEKIYFSTEEVAQRAGISADDVMMFIELKKIPYKRTIKGKRQYTIDTINGIKKAILLLVKEEIKSRSQRKPRIKQFTKQWWSSAKRITSLVSQANAEDNSKLKNQIKYKVKSELKKVYQ